MRYLKNKLSWVTILTFVLSLSQLTLFAQDDGPGGLPGGDGGGCDPFLDPDCTPDSGAAPLDNWVFLLVFLVFAFPMWYYYKQKKSLRSL